MKASEAIRRAKSGGNSKVSGDHLVVNALAGTGKTFTLVIGLAHLYQEVWGQVVDHLGFEPKPSPQQAAVWEALADGTRPRSIAYVAFNRSIVAEFEEKYSWLVAALKKVDVTLTFATCHKLGFAACCREYGITFRNINRWKTRNIIEEVTGKDSREMMRDNRGRVILQATEALVKHCKLSLLEPEADILDSLALHYGIELNGEREEVYALVEKVLERSRDPQVCRTEIDFDDQVWLPSVNGLSMFRHDLVLGDEAQDWNKAQQEIILKVGKRFLVCGDTNQAIYGFAGADIDSIPTTTRKLEERGTVRVLPLTETRRCGRAIVDRAKQLVPEFTAHQDNPAGEVIRMGSAEAFAAMQDSDMVLCRVNAPLCSVAFRLIKDGRKANIQGRAIGDGLVKLIDKLLGKRGKNVGDLLAKVDDWYQREAQKLASRKNPDDTAIIALQDKRDCILAFCEDAVSVDEVKERIHQTFQGKQCPKCGKGFNEEATDCFRCKVPLVKPEGVLLSSIHRSKGLEADRVFILEPQLLPHPMARTDWAKGQERNLEYVAVTRAIHTLVFIDN